MKRTAYVYLVDNKTFIDSVWTKRYMAIRRRDRLRTELRDKSWTATRLPLNRRGVDGDVL